MTPDEQDLAEAIRALRTEPMPWEQEPNKPHGVVGMWPWTQVQATWWVQTPKGEWLEVLKVERRAGAQVLLLRMPDGREVETIRQGQDAAKHVPVRTGTHTDMSADALFKAFPRHEILEDGNG